MMIKNLLIGIQGRERLCVILATATLVAFLIGISLSRLVYPYDVGHFEACVWQPSLLAVSGMSPYDYAMQPPFVMAPYGYFYYLVIGFGLKLFGLQLWFGRLVSVLAAAIIIICIWHISMSLTKKWQAALFAVVVFLSSITLHSWIAVQRPDLPGLALAFAGLALVFGAGARSDKISLYSFLIAFLFTGAFFFKQTLILPVLVAFARYLQAGGKRQAFFVLAVTLGLCVLITVLLNVNSQGGHLWQHFKLTKEIPYSYSASARMLMGVLKSPSPWVLFVIMALFMSNKFSTLRETGPWPGLGLGGTTLVKRLRKTLEAPDLLLCFYFIAAVILAFITAARSGANINYYLEPSIVISIIASIAWAQLSLNKRLCRLFLPSLLLLVLAGLFQLVRVARGEYYRWQALPYYKEVVSTLNRLTQPQSVGISVYPDLIVAAGRKYHFGDWTQYIDGRSPELQNLFQKAIESNDYPVMIWFGKDEYNFFPGYSLVPISQPLPERFYPVYLYARDPYSPPH